MGAHFSSGKSEGLIRRIYPQRPALSTAPQAHRRPVGTWIGFDAPLPDGYSEDRR